MVKRLFLYFLMVLLVTEVFKVIFPGEADKIYRQGFMLVPE